jgi:hypothetical protein
VAAETGRWNATTETAGSSASAVHNLIPTAFGCVLCGISQCHGKKTLKRLAVYVLVYGGVIHGYGV